MLMLNPDYRGYSDKITFLLQEKINLNNVLNRAAGKRIYFFTAETWRSLRETPRKSL
jgi:hypothetical protein